MSQFTVSIEGGVDKGQGLFGLRNGQEFGIKIGNNTNAPANAYILVQGKGVGGFRVNAGESWVVERPSKANRNFVFAKEGTAEAYAGGILDGKASNGLIEVQFVPKHSKAGGMEGEDLAPGGIALGSVAKQQFARAPPMTLDWSKMEQLYLRVVSLD